MKKKIALFANNWNSDNITSFLDGVKKTMPENYADIFIFMAGNSYGRTVVYNNAECAIHFLPDLTQFDAAIVFSQGLNSNEVRDEIYKKCEEAGIPTVCIGGDDPRFYGVLVDNTTGMRELCEHLFDEHKARKYKFFAGARENDDSNIRLNCLKEFLKEKDIPFDDENDVVYTNWEISATMNYISWMYQDKNNLPDSFICANDFLAVAACVGLRKLGYEIPGDVSITGFDYVMSGRTFYPSISTVDQNFDIQGEMCVEILMNIFNGEKAPKITHVPSVFLPGESCGCKTPRNEDSIRRFFCQDLISRNIEDNARQSILNSIRNAFSESNRLSILPSKLQAVIYSIQDENMETFHIMLDPLLENVILKETSKDREYTFPDNFQVFVSREKGMQTNVQRLKKGELIPGYKGEGENEIYVLMPLHVDSYVCGFMVMRGCQATIRPWIFNYYQSNLVHSISQFKTTIQMASLNDRLSELMQTDALTSLKNRTAFENSKEMLRNHYLSGDDHRFAVVMFDLNNLKKINDEFGHGVGDVYIKNSSELICNTFKHSPVYRVGGDEFVAIIKNTDYPQRYELFEKFKTEVKILKDAMDLPIMKRISVACGMADYDEVVNDDIDSIFKLADDRMYENKKEMKATRE